MKKKKSEGVAAKKPSSQRPFGGFKNSQSNKIQQNGHKMAHRLSNGPSVTQNNGAELPQKLNNFKQKDGPKPPQKTGPKVV